MDESDKKVHLHGEPGCPAEAGDEGQDAEPTHLVDEDKQQLSLKQWLEISAILAGMEKLEDFAINVINRVGQMT